MSTKAYYNEIDKHCVGVLRRQIAAGNLPDGVVDDRDIRAVDPAELKQYREWHFFAGIGGIPLGFFRTGLTDAIGTIATGGFPCQDLSVAGKRAGFAGERSSLWFEFYRLLAELKPEWVVIENVPGLLSSNGGRDFAVLLQGLVGLRYGVCWRILDAQYTGVAQRRRRVFIVGHLGDGRAAEVLFERDGSKWDSPPRRTKGEGVAGTLKGGSGQRSYPDPSDGNGGGLIAGTVSSKWAKGTGGPSGDEVQNLVAQAVDVRNFTDNGDISGTIQSKKSGGYSLNYQNPIAFEWTRSAGSRRTQIVRTGGEYAQIRSTSVDAIVFNTTQITSKENGSNPRPGDPSHALASTNHPPALVHQHAVRRLTPTECERLQGFPDGWTAGQSDSARYRQLGNAVCVTEAEAIARRLKAIAQGESISKHEKELSTK